MQLLNAKLKMKARREEATSPTTKRRKRNSDFVTCCCAQELELNAFVIVIEVVGRIKSEIYLQQTLATTVE